MMLGEMQVCGKPRPKLLKAFAVLADALHPTFDRQPHLKPQCSRESCVLVCLTVADFLTGVGFRTARVAPAVFVARAEKDGKLVHSAAIGAPHDKRKIEGRWKGHMVVTVNGFLIDTTLHQIARPAWPDLATMMAVPLAPRPWHRSQTWWGLEVMSSAEAGELAIGWFDNPANVSWKQGPDARNASLRRPVVRALVERFGKWED